MTTESNSDDHYRQLYWEQVVKVDRLLEEIEILKKELEFMEMEQLKSVPNNISLNSYPVFVSDIVIASIELSMQHVPDSIEKQVIELWLGQIENAY